MTSQPLEDFKRIRTPEFLILLSYSRARFWRDRKKGLIPEPDGYDGVGNQAFWFQSTVLNFLSNPTGVKTIHRASYLHLSNKNSKKPKGIEAPPKPSNIKINKVTL